MAFRLIQEEESKVNTKSIEDIIENKLLPPVACLDIVRQNSPIEIINTSSSAKQRAKSPS